MFRIRTFPNIITHTMESNLPPVLYFNGLERTKSGFSERVILPYFYERLNGILFEHVPTDWHSPEKQFPDLLEEATERARETLNEYGQVTLVGASAGGGLVLNTYSNLDSHERASTSVFCLSSCLNLHDEQRLRRIALDRANKKPSHAYIDSVVRCRDVVIPNLNRQDKQRITTVIPRRDQVVPIETMTIEGTTQYKVEGYGHTSGIVIGLLHVPRLQIARLLTDRTPE